MDAGFCWRHVERCGLRLCSNVETEAVDLPRVPLWLPEGGGSAVTIKTTPDGVLAHTWVSFPALVFLVKETKAVIDNKGRNTDEVYVLRGGVVARLS